MGYTQRQMSLALGERCLCFTDEVAAELQIGRESEEVAQQHNAGRSGVAPSRRCVAEAFS
jgi:hypothetical protein